jgi:hypothetical protein
VYVESSNILYMHKVVDGRGRVRTVLKFAGDGTLDIAEEPREVARKIEEALTSRRVEPD